VAEPVNLNKARKAKSRAGDKAKAAENRVAFGRGKVEKVVAKLDALRASQALDGKRREP
jgi:Domain of unknown function (DUF4169)